MELGELIADLERLRPATRPFLNLVVIERTASTNRLGQRIARDYLGEGVAVPRVLLVAFEQREGRGRQGRGWHSPAGAGAYATLVLDREPGDRLATLPLAVGVGLASAINELLPGERCRLKWPNDLVTRRGKLGGILIEALSAGEGEAVAVVGFGVNRGLASGEPPVAGATTLWREIRAEPPSLARLTWSLVTHVIEEIERERKEGAAVERYRDLSIHRPGDELSCRLGGETVSGVFRGFDERGFLRLEQAGRVRTIAAGEVVER